MAAALAFRSACRGLVADARITRGDSQNVLRLDLQLSEVYVSRWASACVGVLPRPNMQVKQIRCIKFPRSLASVARSGGVSVRQGGKGAERCCQSALQPVVNIAYFWDRF